MKNSKFRILRHNVHFGYTGELSQLANIILDILSQLQTLYKEHSVKERGWLYVGKEKSNLKYVSIVLYNLSPTFKNVAIVSYSMSLFLNPCFTYFIGCVFLPYQASRHLEEFRLTTL